MVSWLPLAGIYWDDETRLQVPHWALFDRLTISDDLRRAQDAAKQYSDEMVAALNEGGDEVTSKVNDGLEHFSATFDLTKNERRPVWFLDLPEKLEHSY